APLLPGQGGCSVESELLRNGAVDAVTELLGAVLLEELRPELRDAGVVDLCLELGVGVDCRGRRRQALAVRDDREDGAVFPLARETIVEAHVVFSSVRGSGASPFDASAAPAPRRPWPTEGSPSRSRSPTRRAPRDSRG